MSAIISVSIDVTKIDKSKLVQGKYLNIDLVVNNDTNAYGQNCSLAHSQSKEERESKLPRLFLGNGKVVWNDGVIANAEKKEVVSNATQNAARETVSDDLPF